ncbi:hypothetical protein HPB48_004624 [Haemaphysalis longicornis]|uniref:Uncharacterized protein n=1 Tax=Haemaphysalis longicornis TaxID=44386 RepID=A0A9J6H2Y9_HAELO|nr:hypothetical protein HPB48_004624 [Haemaphysalis longicornis]
MGLNVDATVSHTFLLQGKKIEQTSTYKYLGVTVSDRPNYLEQQEKSLLAKSNRLKRRVWNLARHSYNPYIVGRTLWKALGVPAVTYAGDVLAYSTPAMKCLDRHQNELGRWLHGGNSATATAAVTGEMGWSPYEIRETRSKILYAGRLKFMPETNVSKRMYLHLRYRNIKTHWIRRITALEAKYGRDSKRHETKSAAAWDKVTIKEITEASTKACRAAVAKKQSLTLYAQHTTEPQQRPFYCGERESGFLFQARTGSLLTQQRRHDRNVRVRPEVPAVRSPQQNSGPHPLRKPQDARRRLGSQGPSRKLGSVRELNTGPGQRGRAHEATPPPLGAALPAR